VSEEQVKQVVQDIANSILRNMPLRLLNTKDGKIYAHPALITKFEESRIFRSILFLTTTRCALEQKQYIVEVVKPFFAYAMLSHRWEAQELGFKDIPQEGVYSSTFDKVRNLCREARRHNLHWAWVDTCCIDQTNSVEVQKSISSMFSWYRESALTIIYLSDVVESTDQALFLSQWFRRGWTLQELLDPILSIHSVQPQGRSRDSGCVTIRNWDTKKLPQILLSKCRAPSNEAAMGL
jgi:hypothetical protein